MTWRPIAESGVDFEFNTAFGSPSMLGSLVSASMQSGPAWDISFPDNVDRNIRVTVQTYDSQVAFDEAPSVFTFRPLVGADVEVVNEIEGATAEFEPNPVSGRGHTVSYSPGNGVETVRDEAYSMLVEVEAVVGCQELGRVTRALVSGYTRARVHDSKLYPNERRCLVANFNGAIPRGLTIARAEWRMDVQNSVSMADARIQGREAQVMITAAYRGEAVLRCEVTLDNGEVYNQLFRVCVLPGPWFGDERTAVGPLVLVVEA